MNVLATPIVLGIEQPPDSDWLYKPDEVVNPFDGP